MRGLVLALLAPLALLTGCAGLGTLPPGPGTVADQTINDERAALGVEVMYQGWRSAVTTGVELGLVKGELAGRLQALDTRIYAAVGVARRAYDAGQSASYAMAAAQVAELIAEGTNLMKGTP